MTRHWTRIVADIYLLAAAGLVLLACALAAALYSGRADLGTIPGIDAPQSAEEALVRAAIRHGIPPQWMIATVWLESRIDQAVVGARGECGMMQLHPRYFGQECRAGRDAQIDRAARLLADHQKRFGHDWVRVRLAYVSPGRASTVVEK